MTWTKKHDLLLCRGVLVVNPHTSLKGSIDRGNLWGTKSSNLNSIDQQRFIVDRRSVRDRLAILVKNFNKRMKVEEKQNGISPHTSEVDQAIMDIIEMEQASEVELKKNCEKKKDKIESARKQAEEVRKKTMEKCGYTQKRKVHVKVPLMMNVSRNQKEEEGVGMKQFST